VKEQTLKNDPNIKLPAAVMAAAARSEEMIRQMNGVTSEGNPEDQGQQAETEAEAPAPEAQFSQNEAPPPQNTSQRSEDETWEHKYKSIHGRFQKAQEQMRDMADQIQNLQNIISTMQTAPSNIDIPELRAERLITEDEARDYGEDFLNVVGKRAKEELAPVIKAYEAKIAELERRVSGVSNVVTQDNQKKLLDVLDEKMPDWRELNTNQEFLDWLQLPDPFSGAIRHEMLKAAYTQGNASRVLAFFNGFLAEEAVVAPAKGGPDKGTRVPKVPLADLAAPGRAKSAASASAPAEKPFFTRAQIAAFYTDVAAGRYRGRDADKASVEKQIFDAQREGRIR
jgi:hypothetical protein